ncbi:hypothetical protein BH23BAC4_BH23BAC4_14740 [soil metagenome]
MRTVSILCLLLLVAAPEAFGQIPALGRARDAVLNRTPNLSRLLEGTPPVSTNINDATFGDASRDAFVPPVAVRSMLELQRTPNGGFVLQPGYWEMHTQSYCLHAGTHGPGGGDGYLYAPVLGSADDAVVSILRNSVNHPDIEQSQIQQLLWAIVARAKFEDLNNQLKNTASRLLTPSELAGLNRNALDMLPGAATNRLIERAPAPLRTALRAEAQLRQMLTSPLASFEEMERVAVLAGVAPMGPGSQTVSEGRWSRHPDGYYIRYVPRGYSYTLTQIWVPEDSEASGREFDAATHIAVPGNTSRQRLAQSGRVHRSDG